MPMDHEAYMEVRRTIGAAFPALAAWVRGRSDGEKAGLDRAWSTCLKRHDKVDVMAAIDQLSQSATPPFPFASDMERAGQTISRLAGEISMRRREPSWKVVPDEDGPRYSCRLCRDCGYVQCLKSADIKTAHRTGKVPVIRSTYATFCTCATGRQRADRDLQNGFRCVDYDPCRDVWVDQPEQGILSTIRALYENRGESPAKRTEAFDAWNDREPEFV